LIKSGRVRQRIPLVISVGILMLALIQSIWWMVYQVGEGARARDLELRILEERARRMEGELQAGGRPPTEDQKARLLARYPGLSLMTAEESATGLSPVVSSEAIQLAWRQYAARTRMFVLEGGFFILLLLAGVWVQINTHHRLSEGVRQQSNFISGVTHELKSPLTSIRLYAELLENEGLPQDKRIRAGQVIREETDRLSALVEQILRARAVETRDLRLEPVALDLDLWLRTRVEALRVRLTAHDRPLVLEGELETSSHPDPLWVLADPEALELVLGNLVDNALKYSAKSKPIRLGMARTRHWAEWWVADEGVGFAPEESRRLFDRFYRGGNELTRKTKGTGLGLYLVREFVETQGGRVTAESDGPGRGSRFAVALPLQRKRKA
jgi:two-component system sensor histidine kinase SenX3